MNPYNIYRNQFIRKNNGSYFLYPYPHPPNQHYYFQSNHSMFYPYITYPQYPTPYPISPLNKFQQQKAGVPSVLAQYKNEDGTYNINKMMDTAGQMVGTVNQITSIVKGLSKTFKG